MMKPAHQNTNRQTTELLAILADQVHKKYTVRRSGVGWEGRTLATLSGPTQCAIVQHAPEQSHQIIASICSMKN